MDKLIILDKVIPPIAVSLKNPGDLFRCGIVCFSSGSYGSFVPEFLMASDNCCKILFLVIFYKAPVIED